MSEGRPALKRWIEIEVPVGWTLDQATSAACEIWMAEGEKPDVRLMKQEEGQEQACVCRFPAVP